MTEIVLVTSSSCPTPRHIDGWVTSLSRAGHVLPVMILWQPDEGRACIPAGVRILHMHMPYPGNTARFAPMRGVIRTLGEARLYLWTDCFDVFFQAPIPRLSLGCADAAACDQGITHGDDPFWRMFMGHPDFALLNDWLVYSAGIVLMKGSSFLRFIDYLNWHAHAGYPHFFDQLLLNKWLQFEAKFIADDATFFNLGSALRRGRRIAHKGGLIWNAYGQPYSVIHANGPEGTAYTACPTHDRWWARHAR